MVVLIWQTIRSNREWAGSELQALLLPEVIYFLLHNSFVAVDYILTNDFRAKKCVFIRILVFHKTFRLSIQAKIFCSPVLFSPMSLYYKTELKSKKFQRYHSIFPTFFSFYWFFYYRYNCFNTVASINCLCILVFCPCLLFLSSYDLVSETTETIGLLSRWKLICCCPKLKDYGFFELLKMFLLKKSVYFWV